ncbi:MAG TPA: hypothetical protein VI318_11005, partial [Baekduia sp.]
PAGPAGATDGTDPRLSDARTPNGAAGGDLAGTFPNPTIAAGSVTGADLKPPLALSSTTIDTMLSVASSGGDANPVVSSVASSVLGTRPAVYGEVASQFANFGTAGVFGQSSGTGGFGGLFYAKNPSGNGPAMIAIAKGNGNAVTASATNSGNGVEASASGSGTAVYGWVPSFATGRAARFTNLNNANANPALTVETHSTGPVAVFKAGDPGTVNVARIDASGKGFFNGGTQAGGADVAEIVPTCGASLSAGDVVEIDPRNPDCFRPSRTAATARVAGVVSTAPGVTLNAPHGATAAATGPALALAGRVPVKVTAARRPIHIGDLLVASAAPGRAMRVSAHPAVGTVIGKALEDFSGATGTIRMLVMAR